MSLFNTYLEAAQKQSAEKKISTQGFKVWGMGGGFWILVKTLPNKKVVTLGPPDSHPHGPKGTLYVLSKEHPVNPERERESEDMHMAQLYKNEEEFDNANENLKNHEPLKVKFFSNQSELDELLSEWSK